MSFRQCFRLLFVAFFLYIIGDAFYRWDAFEFYGSFLEFLPGLALIVVLWSFLALLTAAFIWALLKVLQRICGILKLEITSEQSLIFLVLFVMLGLAAWYTKTSLWPLAHITVQWKAGIIATLFIIALSLAIVLRRGAHTILKDIHERMLPMTVLFGITVLCSFLFVSYLAWENYAAEKMPDEKRAGRAADDDRPNIILVTFDALTARDMSLYGYGRETTPFIDAWAQSATVFTRHEASSDYTAPSTATLMTGKRVWNHRRFQSHGGSPKNSRTESLPQVLKEHGYTNAAFIANHIASVSELGMTDSFVTVLPSYEFMSPSSFFGMLRKYLQKLFGGNIKAFDWIIKEDFIVYKVVPDDYFKHPYKLQYPVHNVTDRFISRLEGGLPEPYFAWLHLYPPHLPYLPPGEYIGLFDSSPHFRTAPSQDELVRPRFFSVAQQPDADILRARYNEFIRYCDDEFRRFMERLTGAARLNNTVIIVSSDHGESFEHGYFTHGGPTLYEPMTHIPLIIKEPGQKQGKRVHSLVDQADVPATILDMAGIPVPPWMDGRSLVPLLRGEEFMPQPVFSMTLIEVPVTSPIETGTVAVWEGDYKLVHYISSGSSELFNLSRDPDEAHNLIAVEPETGGRLVRLVRERLAAINKGYTRKQ